MPRVPKSNLISLKICLSQIHMCWITVNIKCIWQPFCLDLHGNYVPLYKCKNTSNTMCCVTAAQSHQCMGMTLKASIMSPLGTANESEQLTFRRWNNISLFMSFHLFRTPDIKIYKDIWLFWKIHETEQKKVIHIFCCFSKVTLTLEKQAFPHKE